MTIQKRSEGIYTDDSKIEILDKVDALVFDCDGVLIDITKSYDQTIIVTARHVLKSLAKINSAINIDYKIIDGFKSTGGFNDEVDLTYAAIISIVAASKLKKDQRKFIFKVIKHADSSGIVSVERYIKKQVDISEIKKFLSFPDFNKYSVLRQAFDQIFYGGKLYEKLFNLSSNPDLPGLIHQDEVILDDLLIQKLERKFNSKISMVTGRGKESVKYSLKSLLERFDLANSTFLEDESRDLAKPNPQSLVNSICGMNSTVTLYVGDSMEDLIMAKKATQLGYETIFCGIVGTSKNPQKKLELFEQNGAILVLDSIRELAKVLNLE